MYVSLSSPVSQRLSSTIDEAIGATCANETLQLNWGH